MRPSLLLMLGVLALAACGGEADAPDASQEPAMSEAESQAPPELIGAWTIEYIRDRPVIDRSPAHLQFNAEGQVSGSATCNRLSGEYIQEGAALVFRPMAVTRMMCPEALMEQEQRLLLALDDVGSWRIEDGMLILADHDGEMVFRASPREVEEG